MVTRLSAPPVKLPAIRPEHIWTWKPVDWYVRVYHLHPDRPPLRPRTWGPINRFDPHVRDQHQKPREQLNGRGVNYFAADLGCAVAEAFPETSPQVAICPNQFAIRAGPKDPAALLDLTGDGAMQIGAVATLGSGNEPRRLTQRWARRIYQDLPDLRGIRYRGAHQGGLALAVWDRVGDLKVEPGTSAPGLALGGALLDYVTVALALQGREPRLIRAEECRNCREAGLA